MAQKNSEKWGYLRVSNTLMVTVEGVTFQKTYGHNKEVLDAIKKLEKIGDSLNTYDVLSILGYENQEAVGLARETVSYNSMIDLLVSIKEDENTVLTVEGLKVYVKGIKVPLPEVLIKEFATRRRSTPDTEALVNFWSLCCLNPDVRTRENLFKFCETHGIRLTDKGYLIVYRNANRKAEEGKSKYQRPTPTKDSLNISGFVSESYLKVKSQKKGPGSFQVVKQEDSTLAYTKTPKDTDTILGNLKEMYEEGKTANPTEIEVEIKQVFTDAHSGTTTIEIGKPVALEEEAIDTDPEQECSAGLHVAGEKWLKQNYFGDVGLICLVNPMKVRAIPYADHGKMRVAEYFPIGVAQYNSNGTIKPFDISTLEHEYETITKEEISKLLKGNIEKSITSFTVPSELDKKSLMNIFNRRIEINPEELKEKVKGRRKKA